MITETNSDTATRRRSLLLETIGVGMAELLVALVIFSTALLGIVGTAARVGGLVNSSHVQLHAAALARQQIEALMAQPYDSVADGSNVLEGIQCSWTVSSKKRAKEITLVYRYDVPGREREDTLIAAVLKP